MKLPSSRPVKRWAPLPEEKVWLLPGMNSRCRRPISSKRHTLEYLRSVAYLRPRTNTFQSVFRIRSAAAQSIHEYFRKNNYLYVHTPLITTADCEGSDQMFKLTTFDLNNIPMKDGKADMSKISNTS